MKYKSLWVLLGGLVILSAAFLFLNFRAAVSNTQAEHSIVTTSSGDRLPDAMQRQEKITIVVIGEGPLVNALQETVPTRMRNAGLEYIELSHESEAQDSYENPVLLIDAGEPGWIWTPFFATSQVTIEAGYASNGDTTFLDETPIVYNSIDGPTINMAAEYSVNDTSWGIMSYPGYLQLLADWLAQRIVEATNTLYQGGTP